MDGTGRARYGCAMLRHRFPRFARLLRSLAALALLAGFASAAWWISQPERISIAPVRSDAAATIDGDSLRLTTAAGPRIIRLRDIDAPEYRQSCARADGSPWPCGRVARDALALLLTEPGLICTADHDDRFQRMLARCRTANTPDLAAAMVRQGLAVSGTHASDSRWDDGGPYLLEEAQAQKERRGLWQGRFARPADWRAQNPRTPG